MTIDKALDILGLYSHLPQVVTKAIRDTKVHIANMIDDVGIHVCNMWHFDNDMSS